MNEIEKEIRELERDLIAAVLRRDTDFLKQILADEITTINPRGDFYGKSVMINFDENLVNESIVTDEIKVAVYENTAVVTGRATVKSRYKEEDLSGKYRFTRVYVKKERWRIVAYQATRIVE
jgi:ketosteroid isomerase-like protein